MTTALVAELTATIHLVNEAKFDVGLEWQGCHHVEREPPYRECENEAGMIMQHLSAETKGALAMAERAKRLADPVAPDLDELWQHIQDSGEWRRGFPVAAIRAALGHYLKG